VAFYINRIAKRMGKKIVNADQHPIGARSDRWA
jgi:hypothetical protein